MGITTSLRLMIFTWVIFLPTTYALNAIKNTKIENTLPLVCETLNDSFVKRNWISKTEKKLPCDDIEWIEYSKSVQGRPLIYAAFGNEKAKNVTLVFSMVHGDEITPLYVGFELVKWAKENFNSKNSPFKDKRLVIAPLVNPDGFFNYPKTRTNAHGVDCNRNFNTKDWEKDAIASWKKNFSSNPRRFPGHQPNSEPETLFQAQIIELVKPQKIISIHSPLNMLDYDGPDHLKLSRFSKEYVSKCVELRNKVKAKSSGFFPGSLGNYAGNDLGLPTITLELPTSQYQHAKKYWEDFKKGIVTVIQHEVPELKD